MNDARAITTTEALALLGLEATPARRQQLSDAFRRAARAVGQPATAADSERLRRVIDAHRLLQQVQSARAKLPAAPLIERDEPATRRRPVLDISVREAFAGVRRAIRLGDAACFVRLPAGLRSGEIVRLRGRGPNGSDLLLEVRITPGAGWTIVGDDLWIDAPVDPAVLEFGGRMEVETPIGERTVVWAPRGLADSARLRVPGHGLPARDGRRVGNLYVRPIRAPSPGATRLRARMRRFADAWAGDRTAGLSRVGASL